MGGAVVARGLIQTNRVLDQVTEGVETYRSGVAATRSMEESMRQKRARLEELQAMLQGNETVLKVLRELTDKVSDDSYLESIGIQGDRLNLTGYSGKASALLTILLQSECLADVKQRFIIPGRDNKEKFRFEATVVECSGQ
ncbi:MAG: PilN domain-containing protein, partial [Acidobacteriota bacterium]